MRQHFYEDSCPACYTRMGEEIKAGKPCPVCYPKWAPPKTEQEIRAQVFAEVAQWVRIHAHWAAGDIDTAELMRFLGDKEWGDDATR